MTATTPIYGLPYPDTSDAPNGPAQIGALAVAVDAVAVGLDARLDVIEPWGVRKGGTATVVQTYTADAVVTTAGSSVAWVETDDQGGFVNPGVTTTPITIPAGQGGLYAVTARVSLSASPPTGRTFVDVTAGAIPYRSSYGLGESLNTVSVTVPLLPGDTVGVSTFHTKGNVTANTATVTLLVYKVGP